MWMDGCRCRGRLHRVPVARVRIRPLAGPSLEPAAALLRGTGNSQAGTERRSLRLAPHGFPESSSGLPARKAKDRTKRGRKIPRAIAALQHPDCRPRQSCPQLQGCGGIARRNNRFNVAD
jgi:hypothetical protein